VPIPKLNEHGLLPVEGAAMITSDKGLRVALGEVAEVYTALAAARAEHPDASPEWLAVLTEGFIDHARQLQQEIEEYTGVAAVRQANPAGAGPVEEHVGDLREIDLDNRTMAVRNAGVAGEILCTLDETLLQAAKEALDHRVKVAGVRQQRGGPRSPGPLHVVRLEVLGENGDNGAQ
jgi:hypothetical protein